MSPGAVLEVQATDKSTFEDIQSWTKFAGHHHLETVQAEGVHYHWIRKSSPEEIKANQERVRTATNEQLEKLLGAAALTVVDVREPSEVAGGIIPGAIAIPLGELSSRSGELDRTAEIYLICHSGKRSGMAADILTRQGFQRLIHVIPGMSRWDGPLE